MPTLLLGLGGTCLLVAAVIFLAVAWTWLGVGGRTAALLGLTVLAGAGGQWLARRDLGVAAEALTTVSLGLLVLDVVGADRAGWLGDLAPGHLVAVTGAVVLAACLPLLRLVTPQVVAPLAVAAIAAGLGEIWAPALAVVACAALALARRRVVLPWTSLAVGGLAWLVLGLWALADVGTPTLRSLWLEGHGAWLLVTAALALVLWPLAPARPLAAAVTVTVLTGTVGLPVLDEGPSAIGWAAVGAVALWAVVAAVTPPRWSVVPRVPLVGALLVLLPPVAWLATSAVTNLVTVAAPFAADAGVRLTPGAVELDPLVLSAGVAAVALALRLTLRRVPVWPLLALGAVLTAALYPLPLWVFVLVLGPLGVLVALPSAVLTLLVLLEVVALSAWRCRPALPAAVGAAVWTAGELLGTAYDVRSLAVLVVAGLLAVALRRPVADAVAAGTALVAALGVLAADDLSVALAVHLTVAGALVTLRGHRWAGGLLLAAATWVRLRDLGVTAPEAYTLPTALVLVAVGAHRLWWDPDADTTSTLLPGLVLATVPSLLWALTDPVSPRAVLLGAGCLALVLGGAALRWSAPVAVGALVGLVLVLRELAPYAALWPQWALIGTAGSVLLVAGVTWEARVRDLRRTAAYLGRLR
ncbi:hypothetical protein G5V58_24960 [Nocardioides anomalus]|uniref:DUF2157 domain-containing protein n=1 Tax=Nocardioides anomalus TaxID=2712223 RepID=A0A6G6WK26_9ACTN|nr:hypothetical protein [Nocardioides anomalus]QIG45562.1 hypothetical protein G5V58_24960 [Nocardioides anomalus]